MRNAMIQRNFDETVVEWIFQMLQKREITYNQGGATVTIRTVKGCSQGGVLSPLLWSLVVDNLLALLERIGFEIIGFADDVVIVVRGKYEHVIRYRLQYALNLTITWCNDEGLSINPHKTTVVPFTRRRKMKIPDLHLLGTKIVFSPKVKYLGVTLDSKLNWNSHLDEIIHKATNALWISKRTFGNKWGLRPKMIYWIYTAIVRPRITYASLVWWPKTKFKHAQEKLGKLQRLATISITGAIRSTPSKALDAMLNLLPLYLFVQLEAEKNALRLKRTKQFFDGDLRGHLSILKEFKLNPILTQKDWMNRQYNFERLFNVTEPSRTEWESGGPDIHPGSIIFYTDGSRLNERAGAGITGPGVDISISMGKWPTVFQAEVQAIIECATICLRHNYRHANICIFSDSQAALKALKSVTCTSKLVWECIQLLQEVAKKRAFWVPGHCGVEGNEKADLLARCGSSKPFLGPEPFCGAPECTLKMELKNWEKSKIDGIWTHSTVARQAKSFISPSKKVTERLLSLTKKDLCTFSGLVTGHCPSKYHLKKLGKLEDDTCRFCNLESESSEHLLCNCEALFHRRRNFFDKGLMQPAYVG
ncbi:uncharacterized protein LOC129771961 [Toxorhynchites rutilus septentrionalis]|uniref:uncharacterized protein LOC129771961 n=1 Tax=Toxorhynchites rutilus septentrionalis TaxID=329112 RepID=UPI00247B2701|nr:uncharacterized protein LOC129771961 [Toxorhynchites rutilus septentrionalis]